MYTVVCSAEDREAWLAARLTGVGASETPILLGLTSWSSPIRLWGEKTGRLDPQPETERMEWGRKLEPLVAAEYEARTSRRLERWQELLRSKEWPWLIATPDYRHAGRTPVEVKTTSWQRGSDWLDGAPKRIWYQLQHQMAVTGAPSASIAVLIGGQEFAWMDVLRDGKAVSEIVDTTRTFWELVISGRPPPPDGSEDSGEALRVLYPRTAVGESVMLPDDAVRWAAVRDSATDQIAVLERQKAEAEQNLRAAIGNAEIGLMPVGSRAWTLRTQRRPEHVVKASEFRVLRKAAK